MEKAHHVYLKHLPFSVKNNMDDSDTELVACQKCSLKIKETAKFSMQTMKKTVQHYHSECFWNLMYCGSNEIRINHIHGIDELLIDDQIEILRSMKKYQKTIVPDVDFGKEFIGLQGDKSTEPNTSHFVLIMSRLTVLIEESDVKCRLCTVPIPSSRPHFKLFARDYHLDCAYDKAVMLIGNIAGCKGFETLDNQTKAYCKWLHLRSMNQKKAANGDFKPIFIKELRGVNDILTLSTTRVFRSVRSNRICGMCKKRGGPSLMSNSFFGLSHTKCLFDKMTVIFGVPSSMIGWQLLSQENQEHINTLYFCALYGQAVAMTFPCQLFPDEEPLEEKPFFEPPPAAKRLWPSVEIPEVTISVDTEQYKNYKKQIDEFTRLDKAYRKLKTEDAISIAVHNGLVYNKRCSLESLIHAAYFGIPAECPKCGQQAIDYRLGFREYNCSGMISGFTHCNYAAKTVKRDRVLTLPPEFADRTDLLSDEANLNINRLYAEDLFVENDEESRLWRIMENVELEPRELTTFRPPQTRNYRRTTTSFIVNNGSALPEDIDEYRDWFVLRENGNVYEAFLTCVECQANCNVMEQIRILESDHEDSYRLIIHSTRAFTEVSRIICTRHDNRETAIQEFENTFLQRTKNQWAERGQFVRKQFSMYWIETDESILEESARTTLPKSVRRMLKEITEPAEFKKMECIVNPDAMFCGQLSQRARNQAKDALDKISEKIATGTATDIDFIDATNTFCSIVPTYSGGKKLDLLDTENKIKHAYSLIVEKDFGETYKFVNVYDQLLNRTNATITPVESTSNEYKVIFDYFKTTNKVPTTLTNIFAVNRIGANELQSENKLLLWSGIPKKDVAKVIREGMCKPSDLFPRPPLFGEGFQFSDCVDLAIYWTDNLFDKFVYVFLYEVDLGRTLYSTASIPQHAVDILLGSGFDSIAGYGINRSLPENAVALNGATVPMGPMEHMKVWSSQQFTEYAVNDESRFRVKYIVRLEPEAFISRTKNFNTNSPKFDARCWYP